MARRPKRAKKVKLRAWCESPTPCATARRGADGAKLCPEDVDPRQLRMGIREEREHGGTAAEACSTALDHLATRRRYYSRLKKAKL